MATKQVKYWVGSPPKVCDLCGWAITDWFADAATAWGPWANMCQRCWFTNGHPSGVGRGQVYELKSRGQHAGKWVKTRG